MNEWMDGWMDGWMDEWMDEWTNDWMNKKYIARLKAYKCVLILPRLADN